MGYGPKIENMLKIFKNIPKNFYNLKTLTPKVQFSEGGEAFFKIPGLNFVVLTPNFFWEFSRM